MSKKDIILTKGKVTESLPNAFFKVKLNEYNMEILCTISGRIRKNNINIYVGDLVDVEISPYDLSKGRISYRYK